MSYGRPPKVTSMVAGTALWLSESGRKYKVAFPEQGTLRVVAIGIGWEYSEKIPSAAVAVAPFDDTETSSAMIA
jgi:hypothetical protein